MWPLCGLLENMQAITASFNHWKARSWSSWSSSRSESSGGISSDIPELHHDGGTPMILCCFHQVATSQKVKRIQMWLVFHHLMVTSFKPVKKIFSLSSMTQVSLMTQWLLGTGGGDMSVFQDTESVRLKFVFKASCESASGRAADFCFDVQSWVSCGSV